MIARDEIPARQFCAGTPWVIRRSDLDAVKHQLRAEDGPLTTNEQQLGLDLQ
jgi:hypothetical protein